jgi:hypothetical protein
MTLAAGVTAQAINTLVADRQAPQSMSGTIETIWIRIHIASR